MIEALNYIRDEIVSLGGKPVILVDGVEDIYGIKDINETGHIFLSKMTSTISSK